jgi:hypothetical protein
MGEHWEADDVLHGISREVVIAGGHGDGDGPVGSMGSVCSSTPTPMIQDDHNEAESSIVATTKSSTLAEDWLPPRLAGLSLRYMDH